MQNLFPPSQQRNSHRLQSMMARLVHDRARVDPDSRHFHVMNPVVCELDAAMSTVRRATTKPWAADVRQGAVVEKARPGYETEEDTIELLQGVPDQVRLHFLRRYSAPTAPFIDASLTVTEPGDVVAIERKDKIYVQAGEQLYTVEEGRATEGESLDGRLLVNNETSPQLNTVARPSPREENIQVQVDGLDILYSGRGRVDLTVRYTGLIDYEPGLDVSTLEHMTEALHLVHENGERYGYTITGGVVEPDVYPAEYNTQLSAPEDKIVDWSADKGVLFYAAEREEVIDVGGSAPLHQHLSHRFSMKDWAEDMSEIPLADDITALQREEYVARIRILGVTVDVTQDGYVGNTYVGHDIHHVLNGPHHIIVVGDGQLSVVEPESGRHVSFTVPDTIVGVSWLKEGLLGVVAYENGYYNVYALSETRQKEQDGFAVAPTIEDR